MPGVLFKPADFDSTRKYPLLFFVYGGPGNAEVEDQWGGYYLWHTMLNQKGYLVAIVDNGGPRPRWAAPGAKPSTDSSACSRPGTRPSPPRR